MTSYPFVSVIMVNYNGSEFISSCLDSLANTAYPSFEVIFIDNCSTDDSLSRAKSFLSRIPLRLITSAENKGFAIANNLGAKLATGDYIAFLNVDTEVHQDWLKEIISEMETRPDIGAAQCKILSMRDKTRLDSAAHYIDRCGIESPHSALMSGMLDGSDYTLREVFYAKGAAMLVRRDVFYSSGEFDESYFTDHEEIDLCWRIRLLNYKVILVPRAVVYHFGGGSAGNRMKNYKVLFHLRKNHMMSLIKNYETSNMIKYLTLYLGFLSAHGLYHLAHKNPAITLTYVKSARWVLGHLPYVYRQRLRVQRRIRRVPDSYVMRLMTRPQMPWHFL